MTLATDMPMRAVAAVAREMNLIGISADTAVKATNKSGNAEGTEKSRCSDSCILQSIY